MCVDCRSIKKKKFNFNKFILKCLGNHNLRFNTVGVISDDDCDAIGNLRNDYEMCTFATESNPLHTPCGANPGTALASYIDGFWFMVGSGADQNCGNTTPARWNRITERLEWITEITGITQNADYNLVG